MHWSNRLPIGRLSPVLTVNDKLRQETVTNDKAEKVGNIFN